MKLTITVKGYTATNVGQYVEIVWDVPVSVQEYVTKSESDAVGFQYWYGANGEDEETYEPIKIESVNLYRSFMYIHKNHDCSLQQKLLQNFK